VHHNQLINVDDDRPVSGRRRLADNKQYLKSKPRHCAAPASSSRILAAAAGRANRPSTACVRHAGRTGVARWNRQTIQNHRGSGISLAIRTHSSAGWRDARGESWKNYPDNSWPSRNCHPKPPILVPKGSETTDANAVVTTTIRLRFDGRSTAIQDCLSKVIMVTVTQWRSKALRGPGSTVTWGPP